MKKIHTREKRKWGLSTHLDQYQFFHPEIKKNRPKTFRTEKCAYVWASKEGLKPEDYCLKRVKHNKRVQIEKV